MEFGKFTGNYKNDGISGEFDSLTYSHSQEMLKVYKYFLISIYICYINKYNVIIISNLFLHAHKLYTNIMGKI